MKRLLVALIVFAAFGQNVMAQSRQYYESFAMPARQQQILSFLADDLAGGRPSGTADQVTSGNFIINTFRKAGLRPFQWTYTQSFYYDPETVLHNIWGVIPAIVPSDEYVIVTAHYDHLGKLNGVVYNGADDNASGVTALLSLAEIFGRMRRDGVGIMKNILFVAFDGKELSMAGSDYFVKSYPLDKKKIVCNVNMDILGSTLAPIDKSRPDYLLVLGENTLPDKYQGLVDQCNEIPSCRLHIDHTFYGSAGFTQMMYELGDHYSFAKEGIPALLFTSGFHDYTYKPNDDVDIIDFSILNRRTLLIYNVIRQLVL